jgi:hypothetical protein
MRIQTVKKGIRSNHTIRWAGYGEGTKRNGVVNGFTYVGNVCQLQNVKTKKNKYAKFFPSNYFDNKIDTDDETDDDTDTIINITPTKNDIIKYDSHLRCCQMCGGTRFSCKAVFCEQNQYGKGIYRQGKKFNESPMNIYEDYLDSFDDVYDD